MAKQTEKIQKQIRLKKRRMIGGDVGNGWIKIVTDEGREVVFPHALRKMTEAQIENMRLSGSTEDNANKYCVDGQWYAIGAEAMKTGDGAAKYGEDRYNPEYYGILAAVSMFQAFDTDENNVFWFGSHTPKDKVYRPDLLASVKRATPWTVESCGQVKRFTVTEGQAVEEPVAAYRHAVLSEDGQTFRGEPVLREGNILIIDFGTFTTAFAVSEMSKVDYSASDTPLTQGAGDVLDRLADGIRQRYRTSLKGMNRVDRIRLQQALQTGEYDARQLGKFPLKGHGFDLVDDAVSPLLNDTFNMVSNWGGLGEYDAFLLVNGGGALMERFFRERLPKGKGRVIMGEQKRERMQFCTANGIAKTYRLLVARGKL